MTVKTHPKKVSPLPRIPRERVLLPSVQDASSTNDERDKSIPMGQRCSILELTYRKCRWPSGDPSSPGFFFCGGKTVEGLSYCSYHDRIAYKPSSSAKKRDNFYGHW
jgi:GcrA cell cycle regulator